MRFSALDGLTIGVWGAGIETRSFARMLRERLPRARIAVVVLEAPADAPELTDGARVVDAAGAAEALRGCDLLVRSPGVSIYRPELAGVPTTTPTGLWMAEREGRDVIGITATKGKSTTAKLTAHLIAKTGRRVLLGGNIGRPALDFLDADALADFVGLPHRLQVVHEAGGVTWVDDSISTEPNAARFALESFPGRPVVLIGGGFDRGQDYTALGAALVARDARVFALPTTGERLAAAVGANASLVPDLATAVARAREIATPGTVVLLSPAAPSFNSHRNFEARGDEFAALARELHGPHDGL